MFRAVGKSTMNSLETGGSTFPPTAIARRGTGFVQIPDFTRGVKSGSIGTHLTSIQLTRSIILLRGAFVVDLLLGHTAFARLRREVNLARIRAFSCLSGTYAADESMRRARPPAEGRGEGRVNTTERLKSSVPTGA